MYDAASRSELAAHQRARGALRVGARAREDATVLEHLRQEGCLKARFPRPHARGWLDVVSLNTSGGVAAGDRLASRLEVAPHARACFSAQAAERYYRALPGSAPAYVRTSLQIAGHAHAEWLAQETILYDGCALDRALDIDMEADATLTGLETLVFGRDAMGERVRHGSITDRISIRRAGSVILHDITRLHGAVDVLLAHPAIAAGARAVATLFHVAPNAEALLTPVRAALSGLHAGASAWNGMLFARILAPTGATVRAAAIAALDILRAGRPLPRVWHC